MTLPERIYLDNAATSWPKPDSVYSAVDRYQRACGAPAGRSSYSEAVDVARLVDAARQGVARLPGVRDPQRIVFTANGTDSLNLALHGLLRPGDHVVTTVVEHNSVLRPLRFLEDAGIVKVSRVSCGSDGVVDPEDIRREIQASTKLIAVSHASNVTGAIQPVEAIAALARQAGIKVLIDAAQSLGHLPWDLERTPVDLLAAPGHKGLLGPLGTGILYLAPGIEEQLYPQRQGGTGSQSQDDRQPAALPDRYESGNLNVPGLVGLAAAVEWIEAQGLNTLRQHELQLCRRLRAQLAEAPAVRVVGPDEAERCVGVVSIVVQGYDPQEIAAMLDSAARVQVRAGVHCAPLMHQALGTLPQGGTVRFSVGPFNTLEQIDTAVLALRQMIDVGMH